MTDDLFKLPAWKIAQLVRDSEVSALDVTKHFLERIEKFHNEYHSWSSTNFEYSLEQAKKLDNSSKKGALAGVPVGIKDIFNTEVLPTQMGSAVWKGHKAGNDSRCVSYLRREGAIITGKTDTAEFAVHRAGNTLNPWGKEFVTGTSSGGSAVVVATGQSPIALATQTAGSTIRPASWCGIYAMKPSFGLIARTGVLKTTDTLDNIGFYGRDVKDLQLCFDTLRVHGQNYPLIEQQLEFYKKNIESPKSWRVAFVKGHLWESLPTYAKEEVTNYAKKLSKVEGVEVVELELPSMTKECHELHRRIYNPCLGYYFKTELEKHPELISQEFHELVEDGKRLPPEDYGKALEEQVELSKTLEEFFKENNIDCLMHYSSNGSAPKDKEPKINKDLNLLWTLGWLPVVNIPQFFCPNGLPYGLQLIGPRYSDYKMFSILEHLTKHEVIPEISKLAIE